MSPLCFIVNIFIQITSIILSLSGRAGLITATQLRPALRQPPNSPNFNRDTRAGPGRCGARPPVADMVAGLSQVAGIQDDSGCGSIVMEGVAFDDFGAVLTGLVVGLLNYGAEDDLGCRAARGPLRQ